MHEHVHAVDLTQVRQAGVDWVWEGHILNNVLLPVLLVMAADQLGFSHRFQVAFGRAPLQVGRCCRHLARYLCTNPDPATSLHESGDLTSAVPCPART